MTTANDAIEYAARLLVSKEKSVVRQMGTAASISLELAAAWTELARVIATITPSE